MHFGPYLDVFESHVLDGVRNRTLDQGYEQAWKARTQVNPVQHPLSVREAEMVARMGAKWSGILLAMGTLGTGLLPLSFLKTPITSAGIYYPGLVVGVILCLAFIYALPRFAEFLNGQFLPRNTGLDAEWRNFLQDLWVVQCCFKIWYALPYSVAKGEMRQQLVALAREKLHMEQRAVSATTEDERLAIQERITAKGQMISQVYAACERLGLVKGGTGPIFEEAKRSPMEAP